MNIQDFMIEFEKSCLRSKKLLLKKEKEYSGEEDRLEQFHILAALNHESPTKSLWGMASKHITSIADMVKNPKLYNLKKWNEKLTDLRNYTILLDALLRDMEVE